MIYTDDRLVSNNSASARFRIQILENNNLGNKTEGGGSLGPRKDLTGNLEPLEKLKRQNTTEKKEGAVCTFSPAPGSWRMTNED